VTYAAPVKRGEAEIIEDIVPVYNIPFEINVKENIKSVYMPLRNEKIPFTRSDGKLKFTLPEINCHETIVLEY
jgi:hypothetical protein